MIPARLMRKKMKKSIFLTVLILLPLFYGGCSIFNAVRHVTAPPNNPESSKPENSKPLKKSNTEGLRAKAKEIANASLPLKLDPKAKATGKILIIDKSKNSVAIKGFDFNDDDYYQFDLDKYGLKKEDLAVKPDEIQTVILKTCDKGKQIGQYSLSEGKKIPAYGLDCKVSIINFQISAVVAEKKFPVREMYDSIFTDKAAKEWVAPEPWAEMDKYIKNFPR